MRRIITNLFRLGMENSNRITYCNDFLDLTFNELKLHMKKMF